jgi:hypothetical protein
MLALPADAGRGREARRFPAPQLKHHFLCLWRQHIIDLNRLVDLRQG